MLWRLGFVDTNRAWAWVRSLEPLMQPETWNGKPNQSGRECVWFGRGVNLGFRSEFFDGHPVSSGLAKRCSELWGGDDWNSVLVYKYARGVELKPHQDRGCFDSKVVIINLCENDIFGNGRTRFLYGGETYWLKDGEVIDICSDVTHGVGRVTAPERYSISIRRVIYD